MQKSRSQKWKSNSKARLSIFSCLTMLTRDCLECIPINKTLEIILNLTSFILSLLSCDHIVCLLLSFSGLASFSLVFLHYPLRECLSVRYTLSIQMLVFTIIKNILVNIITIFTDFTQLFLFFPHWLEDFKHPWIALLWSSSQGM